MSDFLEKEYESIWDYIKHSEIIREKYIRLYLVILSGVLTINWYLYGLDKGEIINSLFGYQNYSVVAVISYLILILYGLLLLRTLCFQKQVYMCYHHVLIKLRKRLAKTNRDYQSPAEDKKQSSNKERNYKSWKGFLVYFYDLSRSVGFSQMSLVVITNLAIFVQLPFFLKLKGIVLLIGEMAAVMLWYTSVYFFAIRGMTKKYQDFFNKNFKVYDHL